MTQPPSKRTRVRRKPTRGAYERETIDAILDEGFICHVGFVHDDGYPVVLPTIYARSGDTLYFHGSQGSRMLRTAATGTEVCLTVTLVDGIVLARSAFHSSMNYRSVVVLGKARRVEDAKEREAAFRAIVEHVAPGRWAETRWPNPKELQATSVLALPLDEASAKIRTGPPIDDEEDYDLPYWAGVVPLAVRAGQPEPDPRLNGIPAPGYASHYRRP
jgi:nitroimidazol reductase NimA-like FMN-containing flavoprotein (pyridoxamine 5'-phosphate oxidase superfamily)